MGTGLDPEPFPTEKDLRTGVYRQSYERNKVIVHVPVGRAKPVQHDRKVNKDTVYGTPSHRSEADTAAQVMGRWQTHVPNPNTALPGPDFCKMNRLATHRGMLTPKAVMDFRKDNPLTLTRGSSARKKDPLPSDGDATFKYGRPSERRLEEEIRRTGVMVPIKTVIEGQYVSEWVRSKDGIDFSKTAAPATIPRPRPTIASESRSRVAHETLGRTAGATNISSFAASTARSAAVENFKLSKFQPVPPRVYDGIDWDYPPPRGTMGATFKLEDTQEGELNTVD